MSQAEFELVAGLYNLRKKHFEASFMGKVPEIMQDFTDPPEEEEESNEKMI